MTETQPPVGPEAAAWKRRKRRLLAGLCIPADALPGSLVLSHRRCGKPNCHCAEATGHPFYSLTFMVNGKKRVESVPAEWINAVRPAVEAGRSFKNGVTELLAINAHLLVLARQQRRSRARAGQAPE